MFLRVTKSPEKIPDDHPFGGDENEMRVEATRFVHQRYQDNIELLHETSHELAQTYTYIERIVKRLQKYEHVEPWEPLPMIARDESERVSL